MAAVTATPSHSYADTLRADPVAQAFLLLRVVFALAPVLFGLDKFAGVLTDDWTRYLAPQFDDLIPGSAGTAMHLVGVVEIVAGLVVLASPRFGGLLVAGWLGGAEQPGEEGVVRIAHDLPPSSSSSAARNRRRASCRVL